MARQARIQSPTDYYHIMMRGNNREKIFLTRSHKEFFVDLLREQAEEGSIEIAAYCMMDNHVHIVIKSDLDSLTRAIKSINIKYAMYFNKVKERVGHVFQDRYKSEVILNDPHLLQVIRYVHNNPVQGKIVKEPGAYSWSSYNDYMEDRNSTIINREQKDLVLTLANGREKFIHYHKLEDDNEYLEIKEDRDNYRLEKAQSIISDFFKKKGIREAKDLKSYPHHLEELIIKLLKKTKLSHRKIASLLGISNYIIHTINREQG